MTTETNAPEPAGREMLTRRHALTGAATVGLGLPLLAACGDGGGKATDGAASATSSTGSLTTTADIEVGGGAIFADQKVVVTQPSQGEFKGFGTTCPHQGCAVSAVTDGLITCPCHGSKFSIEDGSVQDGPAPTGLTELALKVDGDEISLA